jgi:hypothetical protein
MYSRVALSGPENNFLNLSTCLVAPTQLLVFNPSVATEASIAGKHALESFAIFERLDTYFLFPFALDKAAIQADHPQAWPSRTKWLDRLDSWIAGESSQRESHGMGRLGAWKRASYNNFDAASPAYPDLLFFNSIVRHVFFDSDINRSADDQENQLRCYLIHLGQTKRLWLEGSDSLGRQARVQVKELRLYVTAQGIGVLSIGTEGRDIPAEEALWINRRLRKLYPPDGSSVQEGRTPNHIALRLEDESGITTVSEENFENPAMIRFYPPLSSLVRSLLYFADYSLEEYEPVLDENMLVYSYGALSLSRRSETESAETEQVIEDFLFLHHKHSEIMRRGADNSTYLFGFTGHSCSILRLRSPEEQARRADDQQLDRQLARQSDDLDTLKTFHTRYYLMMIIALFYRAILLDFSERCALISRRLLTDQENRKMTALVVNMVNDLRTEFLNFCSYWHFDDLSCKQTDNEVFHRLCREYKIDDMKQVLSDEIGRMGDLVLNFYQMRNTDAVNRLAMLSLIFGGGAVLTGFFGMNFQREFGKAVFEGEGTSPLLHYGLVAVITIFVFSSLAVGTFVLLRSWRDYFAILSPPKESRLKDSLKRNRRTL